MEPVPPKRLNGPKLGVAGAGATRNPPLMVVCAYENPRKPVNAGVSSPRSEEELVDCMTRSKVAGCGVVAAAALLVAAESFFAGFESSAIAAAENKKPRIATTKTRMLERIISS